jgi:hypothetical protein
MGMGPWSECRGGSCRGFAGRVFTEDDGLFTTFQSSILLPSAIPYEHNFIMDLKIMSAANTELFLVS